MRSDAAEVLGQIGDSGAVEPLIYALQNDEQYMVRWNAAEALGKIGDPRAVGPLIEALEDEEVLVSSAAARHWNKLAGRQIKTPSTEIVIVKLVNGACSQDPHIRPSTTPPTEERRWINYCGS